MNVDYKKSVGVFGLALPLLFFFALFIALFVGKSWVTKNYQKKAVVYEQSQNRQRQIVQLEKKVEAQSDSLKRWKALVESGTRRSFLDQWKLAGRPFKSKEFKMDLPAWSKSQGLAQGVAQPATQVSISFVATFKAIQMALLDVETRFPQMQLDSLDLKPSGDGYTLEIQTKHTIWTKD